VKGDRLNGEGWPLVTLYAGKGAKWISIIEVLERHHSGFGEQRGSRGLAW
jgi:hypothetical protein